MATYSGNPDFSHLDEGCTGILLTNLGTPDAPEPAAVRRYLAEFLWDPRIIEMPRPLWWLILHGVILRIRPRRSAEAYAKVWTPQGSPLLEISRRQRDALETALGGRFPGDLRITLGMRYGTPSIADALEELRDAGVRRLLVLPLYPQYSATTTASTFDAVADTLKRWRWLPALRFVSHYHDDPAYLDALAASVREAWERDGRAERLLMSFHGLPRRYLMAGDPYHCECQATGRLLAERLGLGDGEWALSFQSRVGREEWLRPYTDEVLAEWGREGVGNVQVLCPGFSADCLETLEEIALQNRELFQAEGGGEFSYIPALNTRADHMDALVGLVLRQTRDWQAREETSDDDRAARQQRAMRQGASR